MKVTRIERLESSMLKVKLQELQGLEYEMLELKLQEMKIWFAAIV